MMDEEYETERATLFAAIAAESFIRKLTPVKTGRLANVALTRRKENDGYLIYYDANISPYLYQNPIVLKKLEGIRAMAERIFKSDISQRLDVPVEDIKGGNVK